MGHEGEMTDHSSSQIVLKIVGKDNECALLQRWAPGFLILCLFFSTTYLHFSSYFSSYFPSTFFCSYYTIVSASNKIRTLWTSGQDGRWQGVRLWAQWVLECYDPRHDLWPARSHACSQHRPVGGPHYLAEGRPCNWYVSNQFPCKFVNSFIVYPVAYQLCSINRSHNQIDYYIKYFLKDHNSDQVALLYVM